MGHRTTVAFPFLEHRHTFKLTLSTSWRRTPFDGVRRLVFLPLLQPAVQVGGLALRRKIDGGPDERVAYDEAHGENEAGKRILFQPSV